MDENEIRKIKEERDSMLDPEWVKEEKRIIRESKAIDVFSKKEKEDEEELIFEGMDSYHGEGAFKVIFFGRLSVKDGHFLVALAELAEEANESGELEIDDKEFETDNFRFVTTIKKLRGKLSPAFRDISMDSIKEYQANPIAIQFCYTTLGHFEVDSYLLYSGEEKEGDQIEIYIPTEFRAAFDIIKKGLNEMAENI